MKTGIIYFIIIALAASFCSAQGNSTNYIGEILFLEGRAELSSIVSGERFSIDEHKMIRPGHKIRTFRDTAIDLILNDGTRIYIGESTSISFLYLKKRETDPWTQLKIDFGKIRVEQKKRFSNKTLEVTTPTAIISVAAGEFSLIASDDETRVLVHSGRVGIVSTNKTIKDAYVGTRSEEIRVPRDSAPVGPVIIKASHLNRWIHDFQVVDKYRKIVSREDNDRIFEWVKRKHETP